MKLLLLLLSAAALCVNAEIGSLLLECQSSHWKIYHSQHETSCIRLMSEPKLFNDAYKECFSLNGRMVSFNHRRRKLEFVNALIIKQFGGQNVTLWNFEPLGVHEELVAAPPDPNGWLVIEPNKDVNKIALRPNSTDVPRSFICEAPARLAAQTPRFSVQPEDLLISSEMVNLAERQPFFATFNCLAFALPKPQLRWVLVSRVNGTVSTQPLQPKRISNARSPLDEIQTRSAAFYDLRVNCTTRQCNAESVQERSQLVVMNPQLLNLQDRLACVASNEFGTVMSREAQIVATRMSDFSQQQQQQVFTVTAGANITIPCSLSTEPDAATVKWFRVEDGALMPLEEMNTHSLGGLQMSKTTFQLLVDSAAVEDSGEYVCRVLMHNGRVRSSFREQTVRLQVEPCPEPCDLTDKPLSVVSGFPAVLSMNPMSNTMVRSGDDCLLECPCVGKRAPSELLTVTWNMTQGGAVPLSVLPEGSALLFQNANARHSGVYSCRCERGEQKSDWSSVALRVLPQILPVDFREFVVANGNSTVTFGCRVPASDGVQVKVTPMRGDENLLLVSDPRLTLSVTDTSFSLTINPVASSDAQAYGCRVSVNYFGMWTEHDTFYTTLSVKP